MKFDSAFTKLYSTLTSLVMNLSKISWVALIVMICIGGVLMLIGNEHGAKKLWRNALYGFCAIQLASMLL